MKQKPKGSTSKRALSVRVNYNTYMASQEWRDRRDAWIEEHTEKSCEICKSTERLTAHHKNYKHVGNESANDLILLCWKCHRRLHELVKEYWELKHKDHTRRQEFSKSSLRRGLKRLRLEHKIKDSPIAIDLNQPEKRKFSKRTKSLRIIKSSQLPETLHQSIHAYNFGTTRFENWRDLRDFWLKVKNSRKDVFMLGLYIQYREAADRSFERLYAKTI